MKNIKKLLEKLKNHERRVSNLEKMINMKKVIPSKKKTLAEAIIELRSKRFFSKPQIAQDVHKELFSRYPCDLSRVKVELLRLNKKKLLRKGSKVVGKTKYIAYFW